MSYMLESSVTIDGHAKDDEVRGSLKMKLTHIKNVYAEVGAQFFEHICSNPAVPNLRYAYLQGYVRNLKRYAK